MIRKKQIVTLVILSLFFSVFVGFSAKQITPVVANFANPPQDLTVDAIITTTFSGVTNISTFVGPDNAHAVVLNSIKDAQTSFYLEVYTLSSQSLVDELIAADGRGVDVQVLLSDDRVNSYEDDYTERAAIQLDAAGIPVYWTSSSFTYTHAKFWIVDSQEAYVYSGNWAPSSIPESPEARTNREFGLVFNDASIAAYFESVFDDDLLISTPYTTITNPGSLQAPETSGTYEHPFAPSTFVEYAEVTPIFSPDNSFELLSGLIQNATTSIDLELQYMKFDCDLLDDVIDAALRGVSIRVLIPEPGVANENVTETLINNGVQVKFFKGLGHNHNKYVSVDGDTVQVSSINWSNNSIENNREAGAIVKNANVAAYFKTVFDYDWANAETPVGFAAPVALVSPVVGGIASGSSFNFQASFAINTYSSGQLLIDNVVITTWPDADGIESIIVDTTSYTDGIHTVKVIGTPTVGDPIEVSSKINIINEAVWKLLITEIRYDADDEPEGEFIEIYNAFDFDIYLENWQLTDGEGEYNMPIGAQIDADDILIFAYDKATYASEMASYGVTAPAADFNLGDIQLANTGDDISLKDPSDTTKDSVAWGSGSVAGVTTWSGGSTGADQTLQREPADKDTNNCNTDFIIDTPNPGVVYIYTSPTNPGFTSYEFILPIVGIIGIALILLRRKR
jgi:phosphatidylserine/phosphatidylglycerophosphate/cardiolipin synthase-like enzyme